MVVFIEVLYCHMSRDVTLTVSVEFIPDVEKLCCSEFRLVQMKPLWCLIRHIYRFPSPFLIFKEIYVLSWQHSFTPLWDTVITGQRQQFLTPTSGNAVSSSYNYRQVAALWDKTHILSSRVECIQARIMHIIIKMRAHASTSRKLHQSFLKHIDWPKLLRDALSVSGETLKWHLHYAF